ncbi:MAG: TRAM domain-containing protein [Actinomycetota bacterium]|nr:TRAM domain-containing protein [Actinomycetota bacterium]MDQ6946866.1 TRAM domain-containing protein [Actinomycetota bacterium]
MTAPVMVTVGQGVAAGGDVLGRMPDGRVLFVEGALPGETLEVVVVDSRRDHAKGRATHVVSASPARITPACPHVAAGCGGCGWAHVDADAQVDLAHRVITDALRRIGRLPGPPPFLPARRVDPAGYRTTVAMAVVPDGRLAYHRHHAEGLVPVGDCRVAHPKVSDLIGAVTAPGWGSVTLRVGVAGGQRLVVVDPWPRGAGRGGKRRGCGVVDAPADAVVVYPTDDAAIDEKVGGRRWRISARSFFQAGPQGAELLVSAVDAAIDDTLSPGDHLVDAYAGVGLLGGVIAGRSRARLTALESNPSAIGDARHNLADLDALVIGGEVGTWAAEAADVVIADPARPGLGRPGVGTVVATRADRLVLVSCDPASLGRDSALLAAAGYRLGGVEIVGMVPDTVRVETVSRFERVR